MALINRISRLFQADMHAVLDQIEEPETLLRQAIREMQENLAQQESQIKLAEHELQQLTKQQQDISRSLTELDDQLVICFKSDKDELAHGLVKRKLEIKRLQKIVTDRISSSQQQIKQRVKKQQEQQQQLASMQQKADIFSQQQSSSTTYSNSDTSSFSISEEQVEVAFLQEKQNWSRHEK